MRLLDQLQRRIDAEQSPFRAQLLREDVARLTRLQELARSAEDLAAFKRAGIRIGWTQGDLRTHEISVPLERLLEAVYVHATRPTGPGEEAQLEAAWLELHRVRMERLIGCLSTPVPKPTE